MKYLSTSVYLLLCFTIMSCNSPNEANPNVQGDGIPHDPPDNIPPGVSWEFNNLNLECGDTIKLHLFAMDHTLSSGSIDFKDGTILSFSRSSFFYASKYFDYVNSYFFDTTISHVYLRPGKYKTTVIFNDGVNSTTKEADVTMRLGTLTINNTTIRLGDTLRVALHTSKNIIMNSTIDFQDGTIVSFQNVKHPFDTTITHIYSQFGSYSVTATFSDGIDSTIAQSKITVQRYYELSLKIGMEWQFAYDYSLQGRGGYYYRYGIHDWIIISSSISNQDTIFVMQCIKNDTVSSSGGSSYLKDTSYFSIKYSYSTIQFPAGSNEYMYGPYTVPNHGYVSTYPVMISNTWYSYFLFEDIKGPTYYHYQDVNASNSTSITFSLIKFSKP